MAAGKPTRSKEKKALQSMRTAQNQIKRYTKLLSDRPQHSHQKVWTTKLEHHWGKVK